VVIHLQARQILPTRVEQNMRRISPSPRLVLGKVSNVGFRVIVED